MIFDITKGDYLLSIFCNSRDVCFNFIIMQQGTIAKRCKLLSGGGTISVAIDNYINYFSSNTFCPYRYRHFFNETWGPVYVGPVPE